jgi:uncharacterized membrane protein YhiD involved in acid resistance
MASVGILIGTGRFALGIAATLLVLLLFGLEHVERRVGLRAPDDEAPR